jgi:hypothetical protein
VDEVKEMVLIYDLLWNGVDGDVHVYFSFHQGAQVGIMQVKLVKRAPVVEMTMLSSILMVEGSAVGVLTFSG